MTQTSQSFDEKDKEYDIWDYIFLDARDLGGGFSRPNVYGPILFVLTNKLLLDPQIPTIRITKINPCYWTAEKSIDERYYTDLEEFNKMYSIGDKYKDGNTMFIITTLKGKLDLSNFLLGFIIDNPGIAVNKNGKDVSFVSLIVDKFKSTLNTLYQDRLHFKIRDEFFFKNIYRWTHDHKIGEFKRLFYP